MLAGILIAQGYSACPEQNIFYDISSGPTPHDCSGKPNQHPSTLASTLLFIHSLLSCEYTPCRSYPVSQSTSAVAVYLWPSVQLSCQVLAIAPELLASGLPQSSVQSFVGLLPLQVILSSPRGRAWNQYSPSLGSTMNVAFLAQVYANYIKPGGGSEASKAKRYSCWAQTQVCYSLDA